MLQEVLHVKEKKCGTNNDPGASTPNFGGSYGGVQNVYQDGSAMTYSGSGGSGAVRIMWAGNRPLYVARAYPSTNTGNL